MATKRALKATHVHRRVSPRVWNSDDFLALSAPPPNAQTLWLYLLTCPGTQIPGVLLGMGPATIAEAIDPDGLSWGGPDVVRLMETELVPRGLVLWDPRAKLAFMPGALRRKELRPSNFHVVAGWASTWDLIPDCALKGEIWDALDSYTKSLGPKYSEHFRNRSPNPPRTVPDNSSNSTSTSTSTRGVRGEDVPTRPPLALVEPPEPPPPPASDESSADGGLFQEEHPDVAAIVALEFPTKAKGPPWRPTAKLARQWLKAAECSGVNVFGELLDAQSWVLEAPKNRKTAGGYARFCGRWLRNAKRPAPVPTARDQGPPQPTARSTRDPWGEVLAAVRGGQQRGAALADRLKRDDPRALGALQAIGGSNAIRQAREADLRELRRRFLEAYNRPSTPPAGGPANRGPFRLVIGGDR